VCGSGGVFKTIQKIKSANPNAQITTVCLSWKQSQQCAISDATICPTEWNGTAYSIESTQTTLGASEFLGIFGGRGIASVISDILAVETTVVVVFDASPNGKLFAGLVASAAAIALKTKHGRAIATPDPKVAVWKDAIEVAKGAEDWADVCVRMEKFYDDRLSEALEPIPTPKTPKAPKIKKDPLKTTDAHA
tara:strand:+ start:256 stop:831 length:576 start_codon:yes stop_codon:yes gene_type:complete